MPICYLSGKSYAGHEKKYKKILKGGLKKRVKENLSKKNIKTAVQAATGKFPSKWSSHRAALSRRKKGEKWHYPPMRIKGEYEKEGYRP